MSSKWAVMSAFGVVGLFTGVLMGLSSSPVVGAVVPLVFGVFGGLSYGYLGRQWTYDSLVDELKKSGKDKEVSEECEHIIGDLLNTDATAQRLPAYFAMGIIVLCVACAVGSWIGYTIRAGTAMDYPSLESMVNGADPSYEDLEHRVKASLMGAYLRCQQLRVSEIDTRAVISILLKAYQAEEANRASTAEDGADASADDGNQYGVDLLKDTTEAIFHLLHEGPQVGVPTPVLMSPN